MHASGEGEAIERYDRAGGGPSTFAPVRWPDLAVTTENLALLAEGVLGARCDFAREAFGPDLDSDALSDRLEEAWRLEAMQVRYAPEGLYLRFNYTVRVTLAGDDADDDATEETLAVEGELCLSFSARRHARPFVDFMGGRILRAGDGAVRALDPFALMIEPQTAVAWGLNGVGDASPGR